jgi:hypothetical protein
MKELGIPDQLAHDALLCGVSHEELCRRIDHLRQAILEARGGSAPNYAAILQRIGATKTQEADPEDPASVIDSFYELARIIPGIESWLARRTIGGTLFGNHGYSLLPLFNHISAEPSDGERGSIPR